MSLILHRCMTTCVRIQRWPLGAANLTDSIASAVGPRREHLLFILRQTAGRARPLDYRHSLAC